MKPDQKEPAMKPDQKEHTMNTSELIERAAYTVVIATENTRTYDDTAQVANLLSTHCAPHPALLVSLPGSSKFPGTAAPFPRPPPPNELDRAEHAEHPATPTHGNDLDTLGAPSWRS